MTGTLHNSIVVITGASSGIGRATALAFAREGATVVVAARNGAALDDLVREIETAGGRAMAVPTDVTDEHAVQQLAETAVDTFDRIDVWVNAAAVMLFGFFTETPLDDYRRVIETNFFGYVHGAMASLPIFQRQKQGTLINVASVVTRMPQPFTSAYVASKHAVRALGMSLREELLLQHFDDVHVVTILPATIDTPLFQHAANYSGRRIKALPPVYPAELVASAIVRAATHPKREVYVGNAGRLMNIQMKLFPSLTERMAATYVDKLDFDDDLAPVTSGNLYAPAAPEGDVSGGWRGEASASSRNIGKVALGGLAAGALLLGGRKLLEQR